MPALGPQAAAAATFAARPLARPAEALPELGPAYAQTERARPPSSRAVCSRHLCSSTPQPAREPSSRRPCNGRDPCLRKGKSPLSQSRAASEKADKKTVASKSKKKKEEAASRGVERKRIADARRGGQAQGRRASHGHAASARDLANREPWLPRHAPGSHKPHRDALAKHRIDYGACLGAVGERTLDIIHDSRLEPLEAEIATLRAHIPPTKASLRARENQERWQERMEAAQVEVLARHPELDEHVRKFLAPLARFTSPRSRALRENVDQIVQGRPVSSIAEVKSEAGPRRGMVALERAQPRAGAPGATGGPSGRQRPAVHGGGPARAGFHPASERPDSLKPAPVPAAELAGRTPDRIRPLATEQTAKEQASLEQGRGSQQGAEQPRAEQPRAEQPRVEQPRAEQPRAPKPGPREQGPGPPKRARAARGGRDVLRRRAGRSSRAPSCSAPRAARAPARRRRPRPISWWATRAISSVDSRSPSRIVRRASCRSACARRWTPSPRIRQRCCSLRSTLRKPRRSPDAHGLSMR